MVLLKRNFDECPAGNRLKKFAVFRVTECMPETLSEVILSICINRYYSIIISLLSYKLYQYLLLKKTFSYFEIFCHIKKPIRYLFSKNLKVRFSVGHM